MICDIQSTVKNSKAKSGKLKNKELYGYSESCPYIRVRHAAFKNNIILRLIAQKPYHLLIVILYDRFCGF